MGREIERKFLVRNDGWRQGVEGLRLRQGYLSTDPARVVRVRAAGKKGYLTVKGRSAGAARAEYEFSIPAAEAEEILDLLCLRPLIEKTRYRVVFAGKLWEVDVFEGENSGLVLAEIELGGEEEVVKLPPWAGQEVTGDERYENASLVANPYGRWKR